MGIPVQLVGIGGPRAPHEFAFDRRENIGWMLSCLLSGLKPSLVCASFLHESCCHNVNLNLHAQGADVATQAADSFWQLQPHPKDVFIRTLVCNLNGQFLDVVGVRMQFKPQTVKVLQQLIIHNRNNNS